MSKSGTFDSSPLAATASRVVLGLWTGSLWAIGYLAAPALFNTLDDRALAGAVAGQLFFAESVLSMICALLILVPGLVRDGIATLKSGTPLLVVVTLVLIAASQWGIRPWIDASRLADGTPGPGFGLAHGASAVLYGLGSVTALAALWWSSREQN